MSLDDKINKSGINLIWLIPNVSLLYLGFIHGQGINDKYELIPLLYYFSSYPWQKNKEPTLLEPIIFYYLGYGIGFIYKSS